MSRFPEYEVSFHGICNGPAGTENLGACSQMAVFHKICDLNLIKVPGVNGLYKPVETYDYPYEIDNRSDEQKILDDAIYFINKFSINDGEMEEEVPLQKLLQVMSNFYITQDYLKEILENASYTVVDRDDGAVVLVPQPSSSGSEGPRSWADFLDDVDDWDEEAGPPVDYYSRDVNRDLDISVVDEEEWETESQIDVSRESANENPCDPWIIGDETIERWRQQGVGVHIIGEHDETEGNNFHTEVANNSTVSIQPDDMCLEDIVTESRSTELADSTLGSSIEISSFTETKGSDNSDNSTVPCQEAQESLISIDKKIAEINSSTSQAFENITLKHTTDTDSVDDTGDSSYKTTSICSMFLEPSKMSEQMHLDSTDQFLDTTMSSPLIAKQCKKLKLDNSVFLSNINENNFKDPQCTSSPYIPSSFVGKKRKTTDLQIGVSPSTSNEDLSSSNNEMQSIVNKSEDKIDDPSTCSNESAIGENNG